MSIALGIMCKAPRPGRTKTRLAALVGSDRAAALSGCFLRDVAGTVASLPATFAPQGYGIFMPAGAEEEMRALLPPSFRLMAQEASDFGFVLRQAARRLLDRHAAAILINSDSPTLPASFLEAAMDALARDGDRVVLGPAIDGGYTLIGLKADHPELFSGIPWSTAEVFGLTVERARAIGLETIVLPTWYDVDDAASFGILRDELAGTAPSFAAAGVTAAPAPATRALLAALPVPTA